MSRKRPRAKAQRTTQREQSSPKTPRPGSASGGGKKSRTNRQAPVTAVHAKQPKDLRTANTQLTQANQQLTAALFGLERAEQQARADEAKARALLETPALGVLAVSPDGRIRFANQAVERMFGYRREDLLGKRVEWLMPVRFRAGHRQHRRRYFREPRSRPMGAGLELYGLGRDGAEIPVEISLSHLQAGSERWAVAFISDITARKEAEATRARLAAIVESSQDAMISADLEGRIVTWNRGARQVYGYRPEEVLGENLALLSGRGRSDGEWERFLREVRRGQGVQAFETVHRRKKGGAFPAALTASAIRDPAGGIMGASFIVRDITESKQAEARLRQQRDFDRNLIETAQMIVLLLDKNGRIVGFNRYLERLSGRRLEETKGKSWFANFLPARDRRRIRDLFRRAWSGEVSANGNVNPILCREGRERQILWNAALLRDETGRPTAALCTGLDITERIQKDAELQRSREKLRSLTAQLISAQEQEGRRIAAELHDVFSQRLAVLAMQMAQVEQALGNAPREVLQAAAAAQRETERLAGDLHDVARRLHPSILKDLGLEAAIRAECAGIGKREKISCRFRASNVPRRLPEDLALCVYRVAQESLGNIVQHSDARTVQVSLEAKSRRVRLAVEDDGSGFDPVKARESGGLGLVTMDERVRFVGGVFHIQSAPGEGTRIEASVPLPAQTKRRRKR